jgi:cellulose biosynthesis protein BcsQ
MNHQVIVISTNKGGVLKTSITTNLAGLFTNEGKSDVLRLLGNIFPELRQRYNRILIDTPPNLGLTQGNVLAATAVAFE